MLGQRVLHAGDAERQRPHQHHVEVDEVRGSVNISLMRARVGLGVFAYNGRAQVAGLVSRYASGASNRAAAV